MASRRRSTTTRTRSPDDDVVLPPADELERLKLSPEVAWYLLSRGIPLPQTAPLWKTPEPTSLRGARFDPARVDRVLKAFGLLRHTKGRFAGLALKPDPWQVAYVLAPVFGWVIWDVEAEGYVRIITVLYVELPRKNGKALALDTPVATPAGWTTQGELVAGDEVFAADGSLTRVVAVTTVMRGRPCYRLTFSDGESIVADANHLWRTSTRVQGRRAEATGLRMTWEIGQTLHCGARGERNHTITLAGRLQLPDRDLPVDPYILGYWLGDGASAGARFTVARRDLPSLRAHVQAAGYCLGEPGAGSTETTVIVTVSCAPIRRGCRDSLGSRLRALGVLGNKHLPVQYLRGSAEQRLAVLQGLMDSDGTVSARGPGRSVRQCEFVATKRCLAEGVLELVASLGLKGTLREARASIQGRDVGPKYTVTFTAYRDTPVFRLARKLDRQGAPPQTGSRRARSRTRQIVSVEPVESVAVRCVQVDNPAGMYLVGRSLIPTHNSTLCGGIGIYLTTADGEPGAQVVAAATSRDQAGFLFEPIKLLAQRSPALKPHVRALGQKILHPRSGSVFKTVANVGDAQHGADLHGSLIDELHLHKSPDLVDALETGTGSRRQPLTVLITTADEGKRETIYDRWRRRIEQLARGVLKDTSTYGVIFAAEADDDPYSEETQRKANPGYGISPTARYLRKAALQAQQSPADRAKYLRLHLGIRAGQKPKYLTLDAWDRNAGMVDETRLVGRRACGGLDLSSTTDITALCWVFPDDELGGYDVLWRLWTPEANIESLDRRTAKGASRWVRQGWLATTPGNVVDYDAVETQITADAACFQVGEIAYDRWNSTQLVNNLTDEGLPMVTIGQGFASLSAPLKETQRLLLQGSEERPMLRHGGHPMLRWMVDGLAVQIDAAGNVKPDKASAAEKIDGVQALVMALARAMAHQGPQRSQYEDDDVEFG